VLVARGGHQRPAEPTQLTQDYGPWLASQRAPAEPASSRAAATLFSRRANGA